MTFLTTDATPYPVSSLNRIVGAASAALQQIPRSLLAMDSASALYQ
jgi:hypothetical protein